MLFRSFWDYNKQFKLFWTKEQKQGLCQSSKKNFSKSVALVLTLDWAGFRLADDMTLNQASSLVGGLSSPSKMPCFSYSIPAKYCVTGSKLVKAKDSVCSECYALKGFYRMPNVKNCLENRYQSLSNPDWVKDRKSTRLNSSHVSESRMPSSA